MSNPRISIAKLKQIIQFASSEIPIREIGRALHLSHGAVGKYSVAKTRVSPPGRIPESRPAAKRSIAAIITLPLQPLAAEISGITPRFERAFKVTRSSPVEICSIAITRQSVIAPCTPSATLPTAIRSLKFTRAEKSKEEKTNFFMRPPAPTLRESLGSAGCACTDHIWG